MLLSAAFIGMLGQIPIAQRSGPTTASPNAPASYSFLVPMTGRLSLNAIAMAVDGEGSIYLTGTGAVPNLARLNPEMPKKGNNNAFVAKFDPQGRPLWLSYVGGTTRGGTLADPGGDYALDIAVDPAGQAVIVGRTSSTDFPVVNAFQGAAPPPRFFNGFVAKLSSDGKRLIYSSYFGASSADSKLNGVAVGPAGETWVVGSSTSKQIATQFDVSNRDSNQIIVIKLNPAGGVVWSTRMSGETLDGFAVDGFGQPHVAASCFQGRACNAFVSKLSASGSQQLYRERIGYGHAFRLAINTKGEAVVSGTQSLDPIVGPWPAEWGPMATSNLSGYVRVLDPSGRTLSMNYAAGDEVWIAASDRLTVAFNSGAGFLVTERALITRHIDGPIFASDDLGRTWTNMGGPRSARSMEVDQQRDELYVFGFDGSLNRSADGALTWTQDPLSPEPKSSYDGLRFTIDPRNAEIQWTGSYEGSLGAGGKSYVARRVKGGPWEGVGVPPTSGANVTALAVSPHDGSAWVGTEHRGVEVISNEGRTARFEREGLPPRGSPPSPADGISPAQSFAFDPVDPGVVYAAFVGGLYGRFGSPPWVLLTSQLPSNSNSRLNVVVVDRNDPKVLLIGRGDGLFRSADRGQTWQAVVPGPTFVSIVQDPVRPGVMFAAGDVIYGSVDHGVTWQATSNGYDSRVAPGPLAMSARTSRLYVSSRSLQTLPFVMDIAPSGSTYSRSWATYLQKGTLFDIAATPSGITVVALATALGESSSEVTIVQIGR